MLLSVKKGGNWYILENVVGSRFQAAILSADTGDVQVMEASYELYNGERRGTIKHIMINGSTGYVQLSEDTAASGKCPRRAIWGEVSSKTYVYVQDWVNDSDNAVCEAVTGDPIHESCIELNSSLSGVWTPVSDIANDAGCSQLKQAITLPKVPFPTDLANYSEASTIRETGKLANTTLNWRFEDAIVAIKRELFRATETTSLYENWLSNATKIVAKEADGSKTRLESYSRAPCLRGVPVNHPITLPNDFGFSLELGCIEFSGEDKSGWNSFGFKNDTVYQWERPRSDAAGAGQHFLSKISKDSTEAWIFLREQSNQDTSVYGHQVIHMVANASTKQIEFVIAAEDMGGTSLGCGVQFKAGGGFMYARGRFDVYRTDVEDWFVDADCSNVPLQDICVDAETIKKTRMINCTYQGLDFLTMKPIVPKGVEKPTSNTVEVELDKVADFFATSPKEGVNELGDPGDWGAYNNADAKPTLEDPQYNIPFEKPGHDDVKGPVSTRANCRVTDELIAQGEQRTVEGSDSYSYKMSLQDLEIAQKDALSVASGFKVVRVQLGLINYGGEAVAPASTSLTGSAELALLDQGTRTSLGTVNITDNTGVITFPELLQGKDAISKFDEVYLELTLNLTASSTCAEGPPSDPNSVSQDWGRAEATFGVNPPLLVY